MNATGTRRIILCILLSAMLILTLTACGGAPVEDPAAKEQAESQAAAQEELGKAENARKEGAYLQAIEYYQAAGDIARESLKETILEFAANFSQYGFYCRDAAKPLAENIPTLIAPEEGYPILEIILWEWVSQEANSNSDYETMAAYAATMVESGYGAEPVQEEILFRWGSQQRDITDKKNIWTQATEGTRAHSMGKAIGLLQEGNLAEGAELLAQTMDNEPWAKNLYSEAVTEYRNREVSSLKEKLEKAHAFDVAWEILCGMRQDPEDAEITSNGKEPADLKRFFNDHILLVGIDRTKDSIPLTDTDRQDMEALCGTNPNGKLIILHKRQVYGSDSMKTDVDLYHMDMLPDEFYPESLEEVEFVVLLETTYRTTGRTYSGGTKEIKETTKLTLYNAVTGKKIYNASANSTPRSYLYYNGAAPNYYSGESPVMNKAMQQVLEKIRSTKTNQ